MSDNKDLNLGFSSSNLSDNNLKCCDMDSGPCIGSNFNSSSNSNSGFSIIIVIIIIVIFLFCFGNNKNC